MADQARPGSVMGLARGSTQAQAATSATITATAHSSAHHGRAVSWVVVSLIMAGFVAGGLGLVAGPTWWLFWVGVALVPVGGLLGLATHIMDDWY